jgi:hypothetical protein
LWPGAPNPAAVANSEGCQGDGNHCQLVCAQLGERLLGPDEIVESRKKEHRPGEHPAHREPQRVVTVRVVALVSYDGTQGGVVKKRGGSRGDVHPGAEEAGAERPRV